MLRFCLLYGAAWVRGLFYRWPASVPLTAEEIKDKRIALAEWDRRAEPYYAAEAGRPGTNDRKEV